MNLQFTKIVEIYPNNNTKKIFILFWITFFISSISIGFYTSCDYQISDYQKGSCNPVLLTAGQNYPMRSNETIFITPLIDLFWDGRNGLKYSCNSNISFVKIDIMNSVTANINFWGYYTCNEKPWLTLSDTTITNSPTWMQNIVNECYMKFTPNFTNPFTISFDINNQIQTIYTINGEVNVTFNKNMFDTISQYTNAINNLDIVTSYQCRSCYGHMDTFGFQSFVRLIITMGTIFSFATIISTKIIPLFLNYQYNEINSSK